MFVGYDKSNKTLTQILGKCPSLEANKTNYHPPFYLCGGFLQSAFNKSVVPEFLEPRIREKFKVPAIKKPIKATCCPDFVPEGIVSIDWVKADNPKAIFILIPGLTGSSGDSYITCLADHLKTQGYSSACYNPRSRGGNELISPFLYSAGFTEDLRWIINHLKVTYPSVPLVGVGFSLGANILTKYLGEEGKDCYLKTAIVVGGPLDSIKNSAYLKRNFFTRACDKYLASSLRKMLLEFEGLFLSDPKLDVEKAKSAKTVFDFDDNITAHMMGYSSATEYYIGSSSLPFVKDISITTLFVSAKNDPVIDYLGEKLPEFESNPNLIRVLTKNGGHSMSWPKAPFGAKSWICDVITEYISAVFALPEHVGVKAAETTGAHVAQN